MDGARRSSLPSSQSALRANHLIGTVAANVLAHGCGALNIDASRIPGMKPLVYPIESDFRNHNTLHTKSGSGSGEMTTDGRWPANVVCDGSEEVEAAFAEFGCSKSTDRERRNCREGEFKSVAKGKEFANSTSGHSDSGSASRFFYCAKASAEDRAGSKHPTVKPLALMRYLCRLVTPPGGTILDPFAGSGTTLQAAIEGGFRAVGIESDPEYFGDIARRITEAQRQGDMLRDVLPRAAAKQEAML